MASRLTPTMVKPGGKVRIKLDLRIPTAVPSDYGFQVTVGEKVLGKPEWGADYTVAWTYAWPSVNTTSSAPGRTYTVWTDLVIPASASRRAADLDRTCRKPRTREAVECRRRPDRPPGDPEVPAGARAMARGHAQVGVAIGERPAQALRQRQAGQPVHHDRGGPPQLSRVRQQCLGRLSRVAGLHLKWVNHSHETAAGRAENGPWFQNLDQQINALLRCDPQAYIFVIAAARPSATWTKTYTDDAALMSNGDRLEASLSAPRWKRQVQDDYTEMVKHLTGSAYAGHIVGIHFEVALERNIREATRGTIRPQLPEKAWFWGITAPGTLRPSETGSARSTETTCRP